jgi:hypothetical protein
MLTVLIGIGLAFFFTIFPYPITSRDILRRDVSREFQLLSNLYTLTQARSKAIVTSDGAQRHDDLDKLVWKEAFKCLGIQARCQENLESAAWEPDFKYKFPRDAYASLLASMQRFPPTLNSAEQQSL